jgi:diguanylate cyclase (GGDEF)-like protein
MLSRVSKNDAMLLASLISFGILTIIGAVLLARAISLNALKRDALQLATHWTQHFATHMASPDGIPADRDHSHFFLDTNGKSVLGLLGSRGAIHDHLPARPGPAPTVTGKPGLNDEWTLARSPESIGRQDPRSFHSGRHVGMIYRYALFSAEMQLLTHDAAFTADEIQALVRSPALASSLRSTIESGKIFVEEAQSGSTDGPVHITRAYVPFSGKEGGAGVMVVDLDQSASFTLLRGAFNVIVIIMAGLMLIGIAIPVFAVWRRIRRQLELQNQVEFMALHDPLTQLPNRGEFTRCLGTALQNARRNRTSVALLTADIDRFREINDTMGHPAGDALLVAVAARFREATVTCDAIAARLGGDEFAIAVQGEGARENALMLARILRDSIADTDIRMQRRVATSLCIGMAVGPGDGGDALTLIKHANMALNRAKAAGTGSTRLYVPSMETETQSRYTMERDLRHAIEHDELQLFYQPQICLITGQVTGYEALLRWHHSQHGDISPGEFIACAEESGLIDQIGEWVLKTACAAAAGWPEPLRVAVNLSAAQFMKGDIVETVEAILRQSGLNAERLEIEITESLLLHNIEKVQHALRCLNAMGISIALDDFGTGYSSLSYLASFHFQKIKIDRSFVVGLGKSREALAVIRAIIGLGKALDVIVIAEGVETEQQVQLLRTAGCTNVQGFLYGRPSEEILDPWAATVAIARGERRLTGAA